MSQILSQWVHRLHSSIAHFLKGLSFVIVTLCLASCQFEQGTPPAPVIGAIAYDQTVQGTLSSAENHWLFIAKASDSITLEFSTTGAPPGIVVLDPEGSSIARIGNNGRLDKFRLLLDGTYTIVIGTGTGDYAMRLAKDEIAATLSPATAEAGKSLQIGDSRGAALKSSELPDLWEFNGQVDHVVSISMVALTFDSMLRLYAPDGSPLATDDNSGGGLNAMISGVKLPANGTYHVQVGSKDGIGEYTLSIIEGAVPTLTAQPPTNTPDPNVTPSPTAIPFGHPGRQIHIGETVEGLISNAEDRDRYAVFAPAGAVISIGMFPVRDSKLIPVFEMFAPNGETIARANGTNAAIVSGFKVPVTGAYIIYPRGDQSDGPYTLSVGNGLTLRDLEAGVLSTSKLSQGNLLRTGDRDVWTWELPANATVYVEVRSILNGFDPLVDLIAPDSSSLSAVEANARTHIATTASIVTPVEGTYTVRVGAAAGKLNGRYTITPYIVHIDPTPTFSVKVNQTVEATVKHDERYIYTFKAVPGVFVQFDVQGKQQFDPIVELYGPSGRRLAIADDKSADNAQAFIQIALDDGIGEYRLEVHGYAMTPGTFTMAVRVE